MASNAPAPITIDEESAPEDIVAWALHRFAGRELVLTTSFGMEGCALIDIVARRLVPARVVWLDTMFLFPETYALRDRLAARYQHLRFEQHGTTLTPEAQARRFGPELWRRDPDRCCALRKVEPMRRVLTGVDVWLTGLTRSQGPTRAGLRAVEWDWTFQVIKVSPLAGWDRPRVWDYVRAHGVPYNELHERGYPTLGCVHCTLPVPGAGPRDYSRSGRWAGRTKTECGLHADAPSPLAGKA
ncbi:MAG TPA: phosphoadenylyl-sulfate reductase [Gemmatimonadales bacterium]